MTPLNRRRFLTLAAVCAGGAAVPWWFRRPPSGKDAPDIGASTDEQPVIWEGIALGAGAQIRLYRADGRLAESVIQKALAEVERLEKIFSLYRDDSDLSRLNREGRLNQPSADLLAVLSLSRHLHRLTGGAFDPSIQPLWHVYADHFRRHPDTDQAPPAAAIRQALDKVGFDKVRFDSRRISFAKPGMGLSLNGIAQGYITDKVTELLHKHGITQALVDMGEIRGLDTLKQRTWQVGIKHPQREQEILLTIPLQNEGFATSGGYGTVFNAAGTFTHLFDPRTGGAQPRYQSISVMAPTAATADALATAFAIMDEAAIRQTAAAQHAKVWLVMADNQIQEW